jgi:hypothetical protein
VKSLFLLSTPTTSAAKTELAALTVAAQGFQDGYSRDLFPHWIIISGTCDTRETVLKRDGTNVVTSSACAATSGTWVSPYDGATWTAASDLDIDHLVPLSNAWKVSLPQKYPKVGEEKVADKRRRAVQRHGQ